MEGTRSDNVIVTLKMTGDEAEWLKGIMQNPMGCTPDEEDKHTKEMRLLFWNILNKTIGRLY